MVQKIITKRCKLCSFQGDRKTVRKHIMHKHKVECREEKKQYDNMDKHNTYASYKSLYINLMENC